MKRTTRTLTIAMMLIVAMQLGSGCSGDNTITLPGGDTTSDAPTLPAQSTMKFDLNFFGVETPQFDEATLSTTTPSAFLATAPDGVHENWINAFVRAIWVQLLMYDALEEPIGAFALAAHSVAQYQEDGSYLWTYIFVEDGVEYSIFLYGTPLVDRVMWRMEVSTSGADALDHFVWFEGEAMNDNSSGYWQFYDPDMGALIRIDWANLSHTEHRLTLTVNGAGHEDVGDMVEFYESSTMGSITLYDASESLESDITWYADGSGSLTVPDYNDGEQACWDTHQVNTVCP